MASTYSTALRLELIGTGDQSGSWGDTLNRNLGTLIEEAVVGYALVPVTDSSSATALAVSDGLTSPVRHYFLELTGTLSANRTVTVPALAKTWMVFNNTVGGFSVTIKVSGQTGVTVPSGKKRLLYCDGTDVHDQITDLPSGITIGGQTVLTSGTSSFSGTSATLTGQLSAGSVSVGDGLGATPSVFFTNETNTGIYRPSANTLAFAVAGTGRGTFNSAGFAVTGTFNVSGSSTFQGITATTGNFSGTFVTGGAATFNSGLTATSGTFTGAVVCSNGVLSSYGLSGDNGKGAIYLTSGGTRYLSYDGTQYNLPTAPLSVGGAITSAGNINGVDLYAIRTATPTQGVVFLGNSGSRFLQYDGSQYVLPGADLSLNGQSVNATLATKGTLGGANTWTSTNTFNASPVVASAAPQIVLAESGVGNRSLYMDGGLVGCLTTGGNWASYTDNSGNFTATANVTAYSDAKWKDDVETIQPEEATRIVRNLRGVRYTDNRYHVKNIGFIAQEVQPYVPEVVLTGHEGLIMAYQNLLAIMNQSLIDAHERIDALERLAGIEE